MIKRFTSRAILDSIVNSIKCLLMDRQQFKDLVWDYYAKQGRDMPWRHKPFDAYTILVSEVMLQQTQALRVIPKYEAFLRLFPTIQLLAKTPLAEVIRAWSGLGYNRRAKYLHDAAKQLADQKQPWSIDDLTACKGIGFNTAAAVVNYAYNQPVPFIETNIRTAYIHHFFADRTDVHDKELLPFIAETIDSEHPREWHWALMDYGSYLKLSVGNASRFSKHHTKQSRFEGSQRQIRGEVLRVLGTQPLAWQELKQLIHDERLQVVLDDLQQDGLIQLQASKYMLAH